MSKFFNRSKDYSKRKTGTREVKPRILIVCEGARTEPNYFESFKVSSVEVTIEGTGMNTDSLVQEVMRLRDEAAKNGEPFDHVWAVFDRDSFPAQNFNRALQIASNENINVAYTNEAFELWYMLHFNYYNTGMSRAQYSTTLTGLLGLTYKKNDKEMYDRVLDKQPTAIANAKRLLATHGADHNPERDNPCTKVFELVELLNKHL